MTREMKNSGIDWIGQVPADWKIGRVKNAFTRKNEKAQQEEPTILSLARSGVKVRDVSTGEGQIAESYYNYNPVEPFDLLLNPMDLYSGANCSISKVSGVISPAYINLKANDDYHPVFYDYYFKTQYWAMAFFAHGKGVSYDNRWTLSAETLMNYYIPVPSFTEQKKIADFLDSKVSEIDKMIAETKSSIENYKEYKQSIITEAVTKGLNKNVQMKDSGYEHIGSVPFNWKIQKIKYVLSESGERTQTGEEEPLSMSQKFGLIPTKEMDIVPNMASSFSNCKIVHKNDLVFNKLKAHLGVFAKSNYDGLVSPDYAVYQPKSDDDMRFLEFVFKTPQYISQFIKYSKGVAQGLTRLYTEEFFSIFIALPPVEEQQKITTYLDSRCAEINKLITEKEEFISNLEEYKKSLIYEYVTGKKEVAVVKNDENVIVVAPIYPAIYNTKKARFAQAVLMSKILATSNNNKGRVKLEKTLYTIEHHIGFDFETEYTRDAAGPLDNSLYKCETIISSINKWFNINSSNYGVSYKPTKNVNKYKNYYNNYFADYNTEIERIIGIFDNFDTDQAEIIATLYGAWNDFVIDNKTYTDEDVVNEVLNNWHDSKKRFAKDVWLRAMDKMRTLDLIPKGYGKKTIYKEV